METKLYIMSRFFEDPDREFHIRELSRLTGINHTTVRQNLNKLVKEGLLVLKKGKIISSYKIIFSRKYINLKLFYNLEKLRKSEIVENLQRYYDFPVIILFGSYAKSSDTINSDIDISVISNIKKEFNTSKYEKILNRKVTIHLFNKDRWKTAKKKNPELINNICNGIVLSGELRVLE
ncbi:MAG TPA: ArsR family transcriptional regulator [Candidatus Pacearchaeota archaeon]|nr:nucleotidyltransferase domain protein [archaeon BMS3Abin17]HDK42206.1 ArsR family transcriptional regulator [Candidatus Pacearchaeota archaeon]HDZ61457.1 ArsR family transcriptional regulator [Candidatus Pacearchaeota archaeon]